MVNDAVVNRNIVVTLMEIFWFQNLFLINENFLISNSNTISQLGEKIINKYKKVVVQEYYHFIA